jgi:hypothetical protein
MQGRPDKWQTAFAVFDFMPDGNFQYQVIRIHDHKFSYGGRLYMG